jgi:DNA-binding phage protein
MAPNRWQSQKKLTKSSSQPVPAKKERLPPPPPERHQNYVLTLDRFAGREAVELLSKELNAWIAADARNRSLYSFSRKAGLAQGTVSRILYRETVEPRHSTVFFVLKALGFALIRLDRDALEEPKKPSTVTRRTRIRAPALASSN